MGALQILRTRAGSLRYVPWRTAWLCAILEVAL